MVALTESEVLDTLARIARADKAFDSTPVWRRQPNRDTESWIMTCGLRLGGVLGGGASIRLKTPTEAWEDDIYGHVEVAVIGIPRRFRLDPVEWRPLRPHTNPAEAPGDLASLTLFDRHHPAYLNLPLGLGVLQQDGVGIAAPLPRDIPDFRSYVNLCADLWRCPDMRTIGPPEWTRKLV